MTTERGNPKSALVVSGLDDAEAAVSVDVEGVWKGPRRIGCEVRCSFFLVTWRPQWCDVTFFHPLLNHANSD